MARLGRLAACAVLAAVVLLRSATAGPDFSSSWMWDTTSLSALVRPGASMRYVIEVSNTGDAAGLDVAVRVVFDPCLDLSGFDPVANPNLVQVIGGTASVAYDAASRTLDVTLVGPVDPGLPGRRQINLLGLRAGGAGVCCQTARITHRDDPVGVDTVELEIGEGRTCTTFSDCPRLPARAGPLQAVRRGNDVALSWGPAAGAASYAVWKVVSGTAAHVPYASRFGAAALPDVASVCEGVTDPAAGCSDPAAVTASPALAFYRAWPACADGAEGEASCRAAFLTVSAARTSVPPMAAPDGSCAQPGGVLPVALFAAPRDAAGDPLVGCPVLFFVDFNEFSNCSRGFGEFCGAAAGTSTVAFTDASGVATVSYTMTQDDLDFCNCLPSGASCAAPVGLCPTPEHCAPAGNCRQLPVPEDLFCQVAIRAGAGGTTSQNTVYVEYGR